MQVEFLLQQWKLPNFRHKSFDCDFSWRLWVAPIWNRTCSLHTESLVLLQTVNPLSCITQRLEKRRAYDFLRSIQIPMKYFPHDFFNDDNIILIHNVALSCNLNARRHNWDIHDVIKIVAAWYHASANWIVHGLSRFLDNVLCEKVASQICNPSRNFAKVVPSVSIKDTVDVSVERS